MLAADEMPERLRSVPHFNLGGNLFSPILPVLEIQKATEAPELADRICHQLFVADFQ